MKKTIVSWSGGKDSAMMLQVLLENQEIQVCGLFTAVDSITGRVPFHGVTKGLIAKQAEELDLPLHIIEIPPGASNKEYDKSMGEFLKTCRDQKILHAAYGDLFLADIKKYREELTARHGMKAIFPLWGERPDRLSKKFQSDGFLAVISGLDGARLPYDFLGRHYDESFVKDLEGRADPCGENGEFHSFVYGGPLFKTNIPYVIGRTENRLGSFLTMLIEERD